MNYKSFLSKWGVLVKYVSVIYGYIKIIWWHRWFAKRFLHPDIVAEYDYIFLWDEDLGVQDFDPARLV